MYNGLNTGSFTVELSRRICCYQQLQV